MYALAHSTETRQAEIELGATLPADALRNLFRHTEVHLNVRWRDLSCDSWHAIGTTIDGAEIAIRDTPLWRAQEVWHGALRLNNGGHLEELPLEMRQEAGWIDNQSSRGLLWLCSKVGH